MIKKKKIKNLEDEFNIIFLHFFFLTPPKKQIKINLQSYQIFYSFYFVNEFGDVDNPENLIKDSINLTID